MARCKLCGGQILWITTQKNKKHPVDLPSEKRWVEGEGGWWLVDAYTSHFGTCPKYKGRAPKPPPQPVTDHREKATPGDLFDG